MTSILRHLLSTALAVTLALGSGGCGGSSAEENSAGGPRQGGENRASESTPGRPGAPASSGRPGRPESGTAVPVEVATVERRSISFYIQTNGTLEAENEVDLVARTSGPIQELRTEEGDQVARGQLLARIEDDEIGAQVEIARVTLEEARLNFERAERLHGNQLISPEEYEQAKSRFETAQAQHKGNRLQLGYTQIKAPFSGQIVTRYVDQAQQVAPGTPLFRISDFDPLLCPVQVPERELPRLAIDQAAYLTVEAWPAERFEAKVVRISPVVDAGTGTVKVTLDVDAKDRLRPGMFARVYLRTATRENAVVIPKKALSLESLGDTVFVYRDGKAVRREVEIGFEEGDSIEILSGVAPGDQVVVVGQDGLSDGTPIQVLGTAATRSAGRDSKPPAAGSLPSGTPSGAVMEAGGFESGAGIDNWAGKPLPTVEEMLETSRERMRLFGLDEEEIERRVDSIRPRAEAMVKRLQQARQEAGVEQDTQ